MAKIYARWILSGRMTIAEVPDRWQAEVAALVEAVST